MYDSKTIDIKYFYLPIWKAYLYDLRERIRIFKRINLRKWVPGFYVKPGDVLIIKHLLINFGKGGVLSRQRAFVYNEYVKTVEENQSRVSQKEYELAVRISRIKKLKLETIMAEMSELKKFGKEVGLGFADMKGLDEDELIRAIVQKVDPKKQKYSKEFVEWYEDLDEDEYFEDNGKKDKKGKKEEEEFDVDEIKDVIENADKIKELHEVIENFPDQFNQKWLKIKDMEELQEKMMEVVEEYEEEKGKGKKEKKDKKKGKEESAELSKKEKKELIELIQETDDKDDLKGIIKEYPIFEEIELRGKSSVETLQKKMLACLGVEVEEDDDEEKKDKKKNKKSSDSDLEEELNDMGFIELKKYAKKNGVSVPPGTTKKDTIAMILEAAEGGGKKKKEKEIEINPSMIKGLVKEKDLESLQEAAKEMNIKLSALEKRNCKAIGEKLIEALSEDDDEDEKKSKKKGKKEKTSVWAKVKEMLEDGEKPKKIKKAIAEMLVEMGIDEDEAEDKAAVLVEVAEAETGE